MAGTANDITRQAESVAHRLRLVQLDFADVDDSTRQQYLLDEIERALKSIMPDDRAMFLEALEDRFPAWDAHATPAPMADASVQQTRTDERELQDPSFLVRRLVELAPSMDDQTREGVVEQLRRAGLSPIGATDWPEEAAGELRETLQSPTGDELRPNRVVELTTLLSRLTCKLDGIAWQVWKELKPDSRTRRRANLRNTLARFSCGDDRVPYGQVESDIEALRTLLTSLLMSIGQSGRQYGQTYVEKHRPDQIEALVRMEGGRVNDAKCWRKYQDLMNGVDQLTVEREIREVIARYAESVMLQAGGRPA